MARRGIALLGLAARLGLAGAPDALAHGGLRLSKPSAGATLGASPAAVETVPTNFIRNSFMPFHSGAARWYHNNAVTGIVSGD